MSQDLETTTVAQPGEQLSWSEVWITAVIRPSTETYERILQDPQASTGRAYRWVFLGSLIGYAISILISFIITSLDCIKKNYKLFYSLNFMPVPMLFIGSSFVSRQKNVRFIYWYWLPG